MPKRPRCSARPLLVAAAVLAAACSSDAPSEPSPPPGGAPAIQVLSGSGQTDTIGTVLPEALEVEVRGTNGRGAAGVPVTFGGCTAGCYVGFRPAGESGAFKLELIVPTDSRGRSRVDVQLFGPAGPAPMPVAVPSLSLSATASATVLPGNAVGVRITPHDTAVRFQSSYPVTAFTYDRYNNKRADPVALTTATPSIVTVTGAGTVTGAAYGRGKLRASSGPFTDSAFASVLPSGTIAASGFSSPSHVVVMNLDWSGYTELVETGVYGGGAPSWSPDGLSIAYQYYGGTATGSLWLTSLTGPAVKLIQNHPPSFEEEHFPRFSRDGAWIYFQGLTSVLQLGEVWRVHPDGSGLERVGPAGSSAGGDYFPDPSPDGTRVVLSTNRGDQYGPRRIVVRDIATGTDLDLGVRGSYPRWSPVGEDIAFLSAGTMSTPEALTLIRSDGTNPRVILPRAGNYSFHGIGWSPDGEWLITDNDGGLVVIQVATGLIVPLGPIGNLLNDPDWKAQ